MVLLLSNVIKYLQHLPSRTLRVVSNMNHAYLRHLTEEEKFELTFHYEDPTVKVNRRFNFRRQASEPLSTFTARVATNLEKIISKKSKKAKPLPVEVVVKVDGFPISGESVLCRDVFTSNGAPKSLTLQICGQEFNIIVNSPWINAITLPSSIMAGFPVYPMKFESIYTNVTSSDFKWAKSTDRIQWSDVGEDFIYFPSNNDIGAFLKISCLPKNGDLVGPLTESVSTSQVQAGPGFCPFQRRHQFTKDKCKGETLRVVSYNILADLYCDSDFTRQKLHPYCPHYALSIDYRKQLFITEITGYNGDIVCLQEVDRKIYSYDLQPFLERLNYGSDFCTKRDPVAEGLACFYNQSRFKKNDSFRLVLSDEVASNPLFADIWVKIQLNPKLSERILDRSSVLQVIILESLHSEEVLVVGNTHLYFHPDSDHIRLLQGGIIVKYLESLVVNYKTKLGNKRLSLILCGDFNSVPSCGIYQLYTTGSVPEDHIDYTSNPEEAVQVPLANSFHLVSACGTPKYTNFTEGFADCLDYIFYEEDRFEVIQVVPLPSEEELREHTALPSIVFPSDHIALIADLRWK